MLPHAIDEHFKLANAVTRLQQLSIECMEQTKGRVDVQQLADVQWATVDIGQFEKPKTWRMCHFDASSGSMAETQFRVQGIIGGKDLPPIAATGKLNHLKSQRRFLRQQVKLFGGQSDVFGDMVKAIEEAYVQFAGYFSDGSMEAWKQGTRGGDPVIEAGARYMTPSYISDEIAPGGIDEYVDPAGVLIKLLDDDFVHGPDNKVEYMQRYMGADGYNYRKVSPAQFKIGDIVEAVIAFVCYPTAKGPIKMTLALRALTMLDHSERDEAAILRMRSKHKSLVAAGAYTTLKRKSAYAVEDSEEANMRMARMRIEDESTEGEEEEYGFEKTTDSDVVELKREEWPGISTVGRLTSKMNEDCTITAKGNTYLTHLVINGGFEEENYVTLAGDLYKLANTNIQDFHLDLDDLLDQMQEHRVYISGSFPLSLTHPSIRPNDLDFYVNKANTEGIVEYLHTKGYGRPAELGSSKPTYREGAHTDSNGIMKVLAMEHEKGSKINVVVTEGPPIQVIPLFHSTVVMNYIAFHGMVMLYPRLTLRNKGMINCAGKLTEKVEKCIEKYRDRGFMLDRGYPSVVPKSHGCGVDRHCPQTIRHLQDKDILHIPFPPFKDESMRALRYEHDAGKCVWQLANGSFCRAPTVDNIGFSLTNTFVSLKTKARP
ncbi:hypothetical protein MD484_g4251, partial [Candolleomyces efflorescens]